MCALLQKYRILGKKGEGTFSEVLKCQNAKDGTYWACKKMKQNYNNMEQVNNLREIQAMKRLSPHPNILTLCEVIFDKKSGTLALILELMDMNIYELIKGRRRYLPENTVSYYMYQLCCAVEQMHRNGIFHRDVKPENILIKDELLKLADFGSCRSVFSKQPYTEYISTRWYRAPECLLTDGYYSYKMDMWSVGCVFFEILSLHPLFPGSNEVDQIAKIHEVIGTPDSSVLSKLRKSRGMSFNFPQKKGTGIERQLTHVSQEAIDLIYKLCAYDPDQRLSAKHALRHPYFKEYRDAEKRAVAMSKTKTTISDENKPPAEEVRNPRPTPSIKEETTPTVPSVGKKAAIQEISLLTNFPKSQSHPSYAQPFKERRRRKYKRIGDSQYSFSNHTGLLPRVSMHGNPNPAYHPTLSFASSSMLPKLHNPNMSMLPNLNNQYKPRKAPSQSSKGIYSHYTLPSLDRRGAGF